MPNRADAGIAAAETVVELERLVNEQTVPTVGTAGIGQFLPGLYNVIPGEARLGLDIRSVEASVYEQVITDISAFARERSVARDVTVDVTASSLTGATVMDDAVVSALASAGNDGGYSFTFMHSGGGHDTQIVAPSVPSAMVFVPCKDGISHSPDEDADTADAAIAVEVILNAIVNYMES